MADQTQPCLQYFRHLLYNAIIRGKSGLGKPMVFDFKYVPQLGKSTGKEDLPSRQEDGKAKSLNRLAERALLMTFFIGCGVMALTAVSGVKISIVLGKMAQRLLI